MSKRVINILLFTVPINRLDKSISSLPQFNTWVPKKLLEIDHFIIFNLDTFCFEQLLHVITAKMLFPRKQSLSVDNPVCRHRRCVLVAGIHSPAYHPRRLRRTKIPCNCSISSHSSVWHKTYNLVNMFKTKGFQNSKIQQFKDSKIQLFSHS